MKYIRHFNSQEDYEAFIESLSADQTVLAGGPGKVYIQVGIDYSKVAMFFENVDTQDVTIGVQKNELDTYTATLETSTDGDTWELWGSTSEDELTKSIPVGGKLYIRASTNVGYFSNYEYDYNYFTSTGKVNVGGNIMSLGYKDFEDKTTISRNCAYGNVFKGMTNLVDASKLILPATTLTGYCYTYMFSGCTSLTKVPELPATTLADWCYLGMFSDCTSLTKAPELPATTLADGCYSIMFIGCTSLTKAPELPAITLASECYTYMFERCSNLNYIKAMFTDERFADDPFEYAVNWVSGVSSTGTFVKNADATWDVTGNNGVPEGWAVETA